jgi:hypothetical protein
VPNRRARLRRRILRLRLPLTIAEYPLEVGLSIWGLFAWINTVTGTPPSNSLRSLPDGVQTLWAVLMIVATLTVAFGLSLRKSAIGRGMYLFGTTLTAYAAAIFGLTGWHSGGATGSFLLMIGLVSFLRGWWLKEQEIQLRKALERSKSEGA